MTEESRYERQLILPQIGPEGQQRIARAKVLIVGVGGIGSASSLYLTAAGVGKLGIVDFDRVNRSNLQRQIVYDEADLGKPKIKCAQAHLQELNTSVSIVAYDERLDETNAREIIGGYDIVVDGCDNFATRSLVSDVCSGLRKPYVYGAISEFTGQVAVLCKDGGKTLHDLYGSFDPSAINAARGVIGTTAGMVGIVQANQVLQLVCGYGQPLVDRLWVCDFTTMQSSIFDIL